MEPLHAVGVTLRSFLPIFPSCCLCITFSWILTVQPIPVFIYSASCCKDEWIVLLCLLQSHRASTITTSITKSVFVATRAEWIWRAPLRSGPDALRIRSFAICISPTWPSWSPRILCSSWGALSRNRWAVPSLAERAPPLSYSHCLRRPALVKKQTNKSYQIDVVVVVLFIYLSDLWRCNNLGGTTHKRKGERKCLSKQNRKKKRMKGRIDSQSCFPSPDSGGALLNMMFFFTTYNPFYTKEKNGAITWSRNKQKPRAY